MSCGGEYLQGGGPAAAFRRRRDGNYPAVEYARASLARKIIRDRVAAGLTQRHLAERAGISFEQLRRIERGKHTPSVPTIDKIDRAFKQASKPAKKSRSIGRGNGR